MPRYLIPQQATANTNDNEADNASAEGQSAGGASDIYIRDTVFLATVLFLAGISGHFRIRQARYALVGFGPALVAFSIIQLAGLPAPP